jgi:uncharacterized membrane protein YcaP (DUF421 family)
MGAETIQPFDWQRMFLGDEPPLFLLEIAFRTAFMYAFTLFITRFLGKRALGDLTSFDYIIVIAIGSATGDPMIFPDVPLLHGMAVLTIVVILERLLAYWTQRSRALEAAAESTPSLLVRDGQIRYGALEHERVSEEEVLSLLRLAEVRDVGEVERAYLEPTGSLSVFRYPEGRERPVKSTFPPAEEAEQSA